MWQGERVYLPQHVNALQRQFARYLRIPHRFICITDETDGFSADVEVIKTPAAAAQLANVKTPEGGAMPSCYRRLWVFSKEAREALGERILLTDIDCVLRDDITDMVTRDEPFVGWKPKLAWGNMNRVAGGWYLMTTGAFTDVWTDFDGDGIAKARQSNYRGSDQAWISYKLQNRVALWDKDAGIHPASDFGSMRNVPPSARVVHFCGNIKPWQANAPEWARDAFESDAPASWSQDSKSLVLLHSGQRIVVMGGAGSLARDIDGLEADVWISVNEHGAKLREVDYVVAMDEEHGTKRVPMRRVVRELTNAPIIGPHESNDIRLHTWPTCPRKGLSGMVATWVAWVMGGHPVILAGFDAYNGTKIHEAKAIRDDVKGPVRVVNGGPLTAVWPAYDPDERFPDFAEHTAHGGLLGFDGNIRVRVRKPTYVNGLAVTPGMEFRVMRHEVSRLLHHKVLVEI